jgi:hypothetical protein
MRRNIGVIDQTIRAVLGLAFVAVVAKDDISITTQVTAGVMGAYLLATAIVLYCPLYGIFGWSSCGHIDRST